MPASRNPKTAFARAALSAAALLLLASCAQKPVIVPGETAAEPPESVTRAPETAARGTPAGLLSVPQEARISGNTREESYTEAKRTALARVFFDRRVTLYCGAPFDAKKNVQLPEGFTARKSQNRQSRIEWEHIVPAENFGRTFSEWREGSPACVGAKGPYKGRRCANAASREYRLMQADLYNLYPAIGAVNAARENFAFDELPAGTPSSFGSCPMKIRGGKAEPPDSAKGIVARAHLYMQAAYPRFRLSRSQQRLMEAWDRAHPADAWECLRAERIRRIQGNENPFITRSCARDQLR